MERRDGDSTIPRQVRPEALDSCAMEYLGDPLARILVERWRITPLQLGLATFAFYLISDTMVAWLFGLYHLPAHVTSIAQNWQDTILYDLIVTPIMMGYYLWTAIAPARALQEIREAKLLKITPADIDDPAKDSTHSVERDDQTAGRRRRAFWPILVLAILIPLSAFKLDQHLRIAAGRAAALPKWFHTNTIYFIAFKYVPWVIGWYMTMMMIAREFVAIRAFRRLFHARELNLYPLHPDGCGGLGPLSRYAMRFTYLIAIAGLGVSLRVYTSASQGILWGDYPILVAAGAYLVLAPFCFFAPLGTAHTAMEEVKKRFMMQVSDQLLREMNATFAQLDGPPGELRDHVLKIEYLQKVYEVIRRFPVWPFDVATLRRFVATVTAPVLPIVLGVLADLALDKLPSLIP